MNYRPVSVLNVFSKVLERFILDQITSYFKSILSEFRSAYRKQYSCQYVLLRMLETWRKCLGENKIVGATLMDLSKAFDFLPHDLLVAKLEAYGLDTKTLKHMLSYLSGRKQCVKIRNSFSLLKLILSDIPQGSIPILFIIAWLKFLYGQSVRFPASFLCLSFPAPFLYIARTKAVLTGLKAY